MFALGPVVRSLLGMMSCSPSLNHAFNVCQWVHGHLAERATGVGPADRFTDFNVTSTLEPFAHKEYEFGRFVSIKNARPEKPQIASPQRLPPLHLPYLYRRCRHASNVSGCWASEDEIAALLGHCTFRALIRRELLAVFGAVCAFSRHG